MYLSQDTSLREASATFWCCDARLWGPPAGLISPPWRCRSGGMVRSSTFPCGFLGLGAVLLVPVAIGMATREDGMMALRGGCSMSNKARGTDWGRVEPSGASLAQGCCREWSVRLA